MGFTGLVQVFIFGAFFSVFLSLSRKLKFGSLKVNRMR